MRQPVREMTVTTLKPSIDSKMLDVHCTGSPYEIGFQHGRAAKSQVCGSILFYKSLFQRVAKLSWREVYVEALKFMPMLQKGWNFYVEEMRGLADGAEVEFESVLAVNVRTEIAYGMFNDGCTALSWIEDGESFLAQNWDVS
jgi:isopenicillin-N N-acyltransferase like protein